MKPNSDAGTAAAAARYASAGVPSAGTFRFLRIWSISSRAPTARSAMGKWTTPGWKAPRSPFSADFSVAIASSCSMVFLSYPFGSGSGGLRGGDRRVVLVGGNIDEQVRVLLGERRRGLGVLFLVVGDEHRERRRVGLRRRVLERLEDFLVGLLEVEVLHQD